MSGALALVAFSALALAQAPPDVQCKKTETQAECHARLKCKANEELDDCKKRLLRCAANEKLDDCEKRVRAQGGNQGNAGQQNGADDRGRDREPDDRGRDREADDRGRDREADDRGRDRDDRGRDRDADDRDDRGRNRRRGRDGRDDRARSRRQRSRDRGGGDGGGDGPGAYKTFGLGLELGEPTGLNGKYFLSDTGALDFGLGVIYGHYYYGDGLHIYADYLWHPITLAHADAFELPFYIGGGLRFWNFRYCRMRDCDYGGSAFGIRIPFGISFDFNNVPLDIFIQLVPVLDFVSGDYYYDNRDRTHFGIDLSVGIRYWFK